MLAERTVSRFNCYTLFLLLSLSISTCQSSTVIYNNNQAINTAAPQDGQIFTCGKLYYRTFHLDQARNVLYVGAM